MPKLYSRDIIAALALIICAVLLFTGKDGEIKALMGAIVGYYFASAENYIKNARKKPQENTPSHL